MNSDNTVKATAMRSGPWQSVIKIVNCLCPDGKRRVARITGEADTYFSIPASVNYKHNKVTGYVTGVQGDNEDWEFHPYLYRKNAGAFYDFLDDRSKRFIDLMREGHSAEEARRITDHEEREASMGQQVDVKRVKYSVEGGTGEPQEWLGTMGVRVIHNVIEEYVRVMYHDLPWPEQESAINNNVASFDDWLKTSTVYGEWKLDTGLGFAFIAYHPDRFKQYGFTDAGIKVYEKAKQSLMLFHQAPDRPTDGLRSANAIAADFINEWTPRLITLTGVDRDLAADCMTYFAGLMTKTDPRFPQLADYSTRQAE